MNKDCQRRTTKDVVVVLWAFVQRRTASTPATSSATTADVSSRSLSVTVTRTAVWPTTATKETAPVCTPVYLYAGIHVVFTRTCIT